MATSTSRVSIKRVTRVSKAAGREADHCPVSSAEVKNTWCYTSIEQYVFMTWCLIKHGIRLSGVVLC
jgi:hypothetical protein